jgi:hypothetical protein
MSDADIRTAVRRGNLTRMHRGVFLVHRQQEPNLLDLLMAARVATRGGIVAGHSAARLWSLEGACVSAPELVLPPDDTREQRPGLRLSWRALHPSEIVEQRGMPVTTVGRTLIDLARREPTSAILPLVDSALCKRLLLPSDLGALATATRRGQNTFLLADGRAESVFESVVRLDLIRAGHHPEELQYDVHDQRGAWIARVDMAWPSRGLVVELDGFATHGTPQALRADLRRQNALVAAGWTVLRFTWADRRRIPGAVSAALAT